MIRWLRGETVGDLCRESAHISCAMVIFLVRWQLKEFSPPFLSDLLSLFYRMFLSPSSGASLFPLDISLFLL